MIIVEYAKRGYAVSDFFNGVGFVNDFIRLTSDAFYDPNKDVTRWCFCTSNIFTAIRLAIVEGKIKHDRIKFKFEDKLIDINEYGAITNWPNGFCDSEQIMSEQILRLAINKSRAERAERAERKAKETSQKG